MKVRLLLAGVAAAATIGALANAQAPAPAPIPVADVVAVRQAGMALQLGNLRAFRSAVEAKVEPKNFVIPAEGMIGFARLIPSLFPPGSGLGVIGLPTIYENRAGFEENVASLVAAGEALKKAADANDSVAFAAAATATSDACLGCHRKQFAKSWVK